MRVLRVLFCSYSMAISSVAILEVLHMLTSLQRRVTCAPFVLNDSCYTTYASDVDSLGVAGLSSIWCFTWLMRRPDSFCWFSSPASSIILKMFVKLFYDWIMCSNNSIRDRSWEDVRVAWQLLHRSPGSIQIYAH